MRIAALAVALSAMPAMGAALEHASQKELDQCKLEASRATDNPQAADFRKARRKTESS